VKFTSKTLKRISNWGYWFELEPKKRVPAGEHSIRVNWPDGVTTRATLRIVSGTMTYNDMGHEYTGVHDRAYIIFDHHGVEARVEWTEELEKKLSFQTISNTEGS
jgi:hypothetical protein